MNKKMELSITTQDSKHNEVSLRLETSQIFLAVTEDSVIVAGCWLSAFEAQTIASALLQMAAKLEAPSDEPIIENQIDYSIEKAKQDRQVPIGQVYQAYEKTLNERIEYILDMESMGRKKLQMQNGLEVLVTKEVWEKESHLQLESDNASPSFMNIKLDAEANWWLVDCLPF